VAHWEYALYAVGLLITLAGVSATVLSGWYALGAMLVGIAVFVAGIVIEERRYGGYSVEADGSGASPDSRAADLDRQ
jgi:hypothetical protein